MGKVRTGLAVSLDGFISGPNDGADAPMGVGGERLLAWYGGGDTEFRLPGTDMVFQVPWVRWQPSLGCAGLTFRVIR
jgi:hypothetical protein